MFLRNFAHKVSSKTLANVLGPSNDGRVSTRCRHQNILRWRQLPARPPPGIEQSAASQPAVSITSTSAGGTTAVAATSLSAATTSCGRTAMRAYQAWSSRKCSPSSRCYGTSLRHHRYCFRSNRMTHSCPARTAPSASSSSRQCDALLCCPRRNAARRRDEADSETCQERVVWRVCHALKANNEMRHMTVGMMHDC